MPETKDGNEKTEPATLKRLREARERGQVSKSVELTTAALMLIGGAVVFVLGVNLVDSVKILTAQIFGSLGDFKINFTNVTNYYPVLLSYLAKVLIPIVLAVFLIGLTTEIFQVGLKLASKKFTEGLNFKQVFNPLVGLKKIFLSSRSIFELAKSAVKISILAIVAYQVLVSWKDEVVALVKKDIGEFASLMATISLELVLKVGLVYILIAIADFAYQKYKFKEDMKMTKQEVKEEQRQMEGDPKIKQRLKQLMRGRIRKIMMQKAQEADVVITNPTHFAVALEYKAGKMNAPVVTAKGADFLALKIIDIAKDTEIPVVENPPLARTLFYKTEINQEIPESLFKAVAQVLAYVYSLRDRA